MGNIVGILIVIGLNSLIIVLSPLPRAFFGVGGLCFPLVNFGGDYLRV